MKTNLIQLCRDMIDEIGYKNTVSIENREEIKNYIGYFGNETNELINTFYDLNCKVDNGGAPILKQVIDSINSYYEITLAKENACLMLKKESVLIDYEFINQFEFETMGTSELIELAQQLAKENNIVEYAINLN